MTKMVDGTLTVSDDVLADLVGYAAKECYGVVGMHAAAPATVQESLAGLLPTQRLRRGIEISHPDGSGIKVDLYVILEYGINLAAVSQNLVDSVQFVLKDIAQIDDAEVVVHVQAMKVREP